jgi:DNA-directed RNA polymerase specialized sigma24 family protein
MGFAETGSGSMIAEPERRELGARQDDVSMDFTVFENERSRLTAIATRILDSTVDAVDADDADDVVQQARIRFSTATDIDDTPAWLTTVVTRLCLDQLRKRHTRDNAESGSSVDT